MRTRLLTAVLLLAATPAYAQTSADSTRATLDRKISVSFDRVDLATALTQLRTRFGIPLAFSSDALRDNRSVSVAAREEPVYQVLDRMLDGTGLRIFPVTGGALVIARPTAPAVDTARSRPNIAAGVRTLEQLVVTGTATAAATMPTDEPGSVNVIRTDDLDGQRFSRTADLFRATLPGLVLRDQGPSAPAEVLAVRGASSFTARGLKAYIDGVEMASPTLVTLVDPRSIERIEVIRGPQGAALYGSDAINGVIQITTRKGRVGEAVRLQGTAEVAAGSFDQSALSTVLRHDYAGLLTGGTSWGAGALSGSMARVGSDQPLPGARTWNAHAGAKAALGSLVLSGMARGGQYNFAQSEYRRFEISSAPVAAMTASIGVATLGITALHQTTDWWNQSLVVGYDVTSGALGTPRSYLYANRSTQPASNQERASRATLRYSSTAIASLGESDQLTTTAGVEVTRLTRNRGTWESMASVSKPASSNLAISSYDDQVRNVGTFMQSKLATGPLTFNAGLRAERSSSFGGDRGAAWSPSVGAAWTQPIGSWALRLRTGWGRGIRPPEPGMSLGLASGSYEQLANPDLAPESQAGVEFGADLYAGPKAYFRSTFFDQRASDLIQSVMIPDPSGTIMGFQYQNVGAIRNRGLELEAGYRHRRLSLDAQFFATSSRVERLARNYSGSLRVGDQLPEIPSSSGSLRLSYGQPKLQFGAGVHYQGSWTGYDWNMIGLASASAGANRVPATQTLLRRYPGLVMPYLHLSTNLLDELSWYLSIDNLTNAVRFDSYTGTRSVGRSVLIGIEIRP